jgi:hypothetical protein
MIYSRFFGFFLEGDVCRKKGKHCLYFDILTFLRWVGKSPPDFFIGFYGVSLLKKRFNSRQESLHNGRPNPL